MVASLVTTFALLSLLSIGGVNAMVPEIHRQVVDLHHWMDDRTFASLVAIAQVAPGPNLLIVSVIGWSLAGLAGLLAATLAMILPSSLFALALGRLLAREGQVEHGIGRVAQVHAATKLESAAVLFGLALVEVQDAAFQPDPGRQRADRQGAGVLHPRQQAREGLRERAALLRRSLAPVALGLMVASSLVMARAAYVDAASLAIAGAVAAIATLTRLSPLWSLGGAAALAVALHRLALAF